MNTVFLHPISQNPLKKQRSQNPRIPQIWRKLDRADIWKTNIVWMKRFYRITALPTGVLFELVSFQLHFFSNSSPIYDVVGRHIDVIGQGAGVHLEITFQDSRTVILLSPFRSSRRNKNNSRL